MYSFLQKKLRSYAESENQSSIEEILFSLKKDALKNWFDHLPENSIQKEKQPDDLNIEKNKAEDQITLEQIQLRNGENTALKWKKPTYLDESYRPSGELDPFFDDLSDIKIPEKKGDSDNINPKEENSDEEFDQFFEDLSSIEDLDDDDEENDTFFEDLDKKKAPSSSVSIFQKVLHYLLLPLKKVRSFFIFVLKLFLWGGMNLNKDFFISKSAVSIYYTIYLIGVSCLTLSLFQLNQGYNVLSQLLKLEIWLQLPILILCIEFITWILIPFSMFRLHRLANKNEYIHGNKCSPIIQTLVIICDVAKVARKNVLAIEDSLPSIEQEILRNGLRHIVDRVSNKITEKNFDNIIQSKKEQTRMDRRQMRQAICLSSLISLLPMLFGEWNSFERLSLFLCGMSSIILLLFHLNLYRSAYKNGEENKVLLDITKEGVLMISDGERSEYIEEVLMGRLPQKDIQFYEELKFSS